MVLDGNLAILPNKDRVHQTSAIRLHAFSDLFGVSPVVFVSLLKECYACGTGKASKKFRALQNQVHQVLYNNPQPGPAVFVAQCLTVLPIFDEYCDGFSHLLISALHRYLKAGGSTTPDDLLEGKTLAARLFISMVCGDIINDGSVPIKIIEVFCVGLMDIEHGIRFLDPKNRTSERGRIFVENYIKKLKESESYMMAVKLLEHFSIRQSGKPFLLEMLEKKDYRAADKWATFMGAPMLSILVQEYSERKLLNLAFDIIKKNNLQLEFPEIYHQCKESSLKKLAEKGCWDVAESKTKGDKRFIEFLVYSAMEAGYYEKVDELCDRYSLTGFRNKKELEPTRLQSRFLHVSELALEDIVWVDDMMALCDATIQIEESKIVGLDCEWSPNYIKGSKPNKVSIMQIASEKIVFILDLIKLFEDVPDVLDNCLIRILHSPRILKLGYNFQCDVKQLASSYGDLKCFKQYEMLLDIQNVFKEPCGGLSGLTKKILGVGLNKTRRNSNWEQRPLTSNQIEYAALDAAVLVHIFRHFRSYSQSSAVPEGHPQIEWKSYIISHMDNPKKIKQVSDSKKLNVSADVLSQLDPL